MKGNKPIGIILSTPKFFLIFLFLSSSKELDNGETTTKQAEIMVENEILIVIIRASLQQGLL